MWLLALRKLYEAEVSETTAIIDTFLQKSVGVADHDSFMKTLKENFDKMIHAKSAIAELDKLAETASKEKDKK